MKLERTDISSSLQLFKHVNLRKCVVNISLLIVENGPNFKAIIESLLPDEKGLVKRQQVKGTCFT